MASDSAIPAPSTTAPLADIVLGLGAADGYSGDDLTNPRSAALRGEVLFLPSGLGTASTRPLELRVHGVGGAPPSDNLETPDTLEIAGDGSAGFYRPWHPGGSPHADEPRREAYCWGKLNVGSWTRALWLLLVAFMIVNVAHFALPRRAADGAAARLHGVARALLRLLALAITLAFTGTTITVLADLAGWQGRAALPHWIGAYTRLDTGPRLAIALLAVLLVVGFMAWLSITTATSYERWDGGSFATEDADWPLTRPQFWRGELTVARQRRCHILAAGAEVLFIAGMPESSAGPVRWIEIGFAIAFLAVAVGCLASPWADRDCAVLATVDRLVVRNLAAAAVAAALAASIARFWWRPDDHHRALPGNHPMEAAIVLAIFGLLLLLAIVLLLLRPWTQTDVMGRGFAAVLLATAACVVATIFGAAFTLSVANILGRPQSTFCARTSDCGTGVLYLPSTVYSGGLGMVVGMLLVLVFGGYLVLRYRALATSYAAPAGATTVRGAYGAQNRTDCADAVQAIAKTWAESRLTDYAATGLVLVTVPTAIVILLRQAVYLITGRPGWSWLESAATFGGTIGVLAIGYFLVQLRGALLNAAERKRFGFLWDVGTFFPRACAPFGPPCYAERSIPEIVTRIRRVIGDDVRGPQDPALALERAERDGPDAVDAPSEAHSNVLLVGYSQGTPISVAVAAQLPAEQLGKLALLTLAAPVRRLYGRAFPEYFGPQCLAVLQRRLGQDGPMRWRNLVRRSDYIGGWVLAEPWSADHGTVDVEILDPPVLWSDTNPSPPPTHRHSDWFPDPQTRPYADALAGLVLGSPDLGVPRESGAGDGGDDHRGEDDQRR